MTSTAFSSVFEEIILYKFRSGVANFTRTNQINIIPQVIEINMFESIFSPVIRAEMLIQDSIGLFVNFPLIGEEIVKLSYRTPDDDIRTNWMVIEKVSDIAVADDNRNMSYILTCISLEAWQNSRINIQDAYNGTAAAIVENIYYDYLADPVKRHFPFIGTRDDNDFSNFAPAGEQKQTWVIPNISPFSAINMLANRIVSNDDKLYSYLFFQNRYGYNLRSIQDMFDKDNTRGFRQKAFENRYRYISDEIDSDDSNLNNEGRLVSAINFNKRLSTLDKISLGYYQNKLFEINPAQKAYNIKEEDSPENANFIEPNILSSTDHKNAVPVDEYEQANMIKYSINNRSENDVDNPVGMERNKWGKDIISKLALSQIDITVTIPADNKFAAGELFYLETPSVHGFNQNEEDDLLSGLYLISEKRDTIVQDGTMMTSLRLQKDSYKESVDRDSRYIENPGDDSFVLV